MSLPELSIRKAFIVDVTYPDDLSTKAGWECATLEEAEEKIRYIIEIGLGKRKV